MESKFLKANTISIIEHANCVACGWPIIHACCNDNFLDFTNNQIEDYWAYCSNKGCKNHFGEGYLQFEPSWFNKKIKEGE